MHHKALPIVLILIAGMLLSACSSAAPTAAPVPSTAEPVQPAPTFPPTGTPLPTRTPLPSPTPESTATAAPTETLAPTPDPVLANIKLVGLAWYTNYDLLLSFNFPEPVDSQKYRVTLEEKEYKCEVLAQYPNRLYCRGQGAKVLATAMVRVYTADSDQPGFEQKVWVPYFK